MNSIKTLYKLMEVSSRDLEIPDAYQRKLNTGFFRSAPVNLSIPFGYIDSGLDCITALELICMLIVRRCSCH